MVSRTSYCITEAIITKMNCRDLKLSRPCYECRNQRHFAGSFSKCKINEIYIDFFIHNAKGIKNLVVEYIKDNKVDEYLVAAIKNFYPEHFEWLQKVIAIS